tara:strand:- start:983 stop:1384 length:402 start_codon:yes stop_codon:yes gene_type:complete
MTDTATTSNVLTATTIRDMVRNGSQLPNDNRPATQQSWVWRSLLYCFREMQRDIKQYRSDLGRVDNRNSPAYWCDWMSDGRLQRDCAASDIHNMILEDAKNPPRNLNGSHLDKAIEFLCSEGVAENVLKFVQR